mmetsp:Transcript_5071/g.11054  ORF Transcript_5071/g.11054 Transcript_5071/m.11054 type:complete len:453 (-) Transcript_5071:1830-3188(-)
MQGWVSYLRLLQVLEMPARFWALLLLIANALHATSAAPVSSLPQPHSLRHTCLDVAEQMWKDGYEVEPFRSRPSKSLFSSTFRPRLDKNTAVAALQLHWSVYKLPSNIGCKALCFLYPLLHDSEKRGDERSSLHDCSCSMSTSPLPPAIVHGIKSAFLCRGGSEKWPNVLHRHAKGHTAVSFRPSPSYFVGDALVLTVIEEKVEGMMSAFLPLFSPIDVLRCTQSVLSSLEDLLRMGKMHLDVSASNILVVYAQVGGSGQSTRDGHTTVSELERTNLPSSMSIFDEMMAGEGEAGAVINSRETRKEEEYGMNEMKGSMQSSRQARARPSFNCVLKDYDSIEEVRRGRGRHRDEERSADVVCHDIVHSIQQALKALQGVLDAFCAHHTGDECSAIASAVRAVREKSNEVTKWMEGCVDTGAVVDAAISAFSSLLVHVSALVQRAVTANTAVYA